MPTRKEDGLTSQIPTLGIIAGSGVIPAQLAEACKAQGMNFRIIGLTDNTDKIIPDFWTRIGTSAKTIRYLKENDIHDLVLIGAVKRPGLFDLWPDWFTFKFFLKVWFNSMGDNSLLESARTLLESMGFKLHGIQKFMPELLMPEGLAGNFSPEERQWLDIQIGLKESQELGAQDIGQAVIIKNGQILGREDKKGTSTLIRKYGQQGAILVKTCKPQQDKDLDLPTIGPDTARLCAQAGMAGIVGQAGQTLLVERDLVKNIADDHAMFVIGVTLDAKK
ncbi:MAG TPA: UDP-2,3-diacylglucosamine diphosphatase LpxI [Alphaproteobacteria bacterium]|nr:UDP-2,3-diacylglucosamine diphosphatase LpxI [Alphaproteobacteria bacterium]